MNRLAFDHFTKKIYIKASLEKLYWCWATKAGYEYWFLKEATFKRGMKELTPDDFITKDDTYTWKWFNWDGEETGTVIQANGINEITLSFAGDCHLKITLEDKRGAVLLTLHQFNIPTDEDSKLKVHYGCSNGWTFWLANLKAKLEYGISLNETEFDLTNDKHAGWEFVNM